MNIFIELFPFFALRALWLTVRSVQNRSRPGRRVLELCISGQEGTISGCHLSCKMQLRGASTDRHGHKSYLRSGTRTFYRRHAFLLGGFFSGFRGPTSVSSSPALTARSGRPFHPRFLSSWRRISSAREFLLETTRQCSGSVQFHGPPWRYPVL
jgi:hypothetical protein